MEQELIQFLRLHNLIYVQITNSDSLIKIHNLFINNMINICNQDISDGELLFYYGVYYRLKSDTTKMVEYYLKSIDCGNSCAMINCAEWYNKQNMHDVAQKYYLMAIDHGNKNAMNNYAVWCETHGTKEDVKKYYLMAIDHGNKNAMYNYAKWCVKHGTKEDVQKYFLMAIDYGDTDAMCDYALWCKHHGTGEDVQKYYLMAIDHDNTSAMYNYGIWCYNHNNPDYKKYFILGCKNNDLNCKSFINKNFWPNFINNMSDIYDYLTDENKQIANELIVNTHRITNINLMNKSLCLTCQHHKKCLFLLCGHPQCISCWPTECTLCNK